MTTGSYNICDTHRSVKSDAAWEEAALREFIN